MPGKAPPVMVRKEKQRENSGPVLALCQREAIGERDISLSIASAVLELSNSL